MSGFDLAPFIPLLLIVGLFAFLSYMGFRQERLDRKNGVQPRQQIEADLDALADAELQDALAQGNKIVAIKRYRDLTGAGLAEAKDIIEAYMDQTDSVMAKKKAPSRLMESPDAGIRDLIQEGRLDEAAEIYRQFAGVDEYTARAAVETLQQELDHNNQS
jgi:hypothetical protein